MTTLKVPCFIFAKASKNTNHNSSKKVTKKHIFNAIQRAKIASKESSNDIKNIILWNYVDDLTLQYYNENEDSKEDIKWIYDMTNDL